MRGSLTTRYGYNHSLRLRLIKGFKTHESLRTLFLSISTTRTHNLLSTSTFQAYNYNSSEINLP
ncbi:hypothetical protein E2C01_065675 [Portunus trituberculatus]|uniref:Uncharacterized protein n=1 Tax=Portunus trituberculatus TaxID=210409 RepID=A0A5B7HRS2_PORTR|nr:hypothetical protein [Portunus trituberculatus]